MKKHNSTATSATKPESRTNWERLANMRPEEIDLSDIPEATPADFARAVVRRGLKTPPRKNN